MTAAAIPPADAQVARDLTDRIKVGVEAVWHLITEAYTSRAWAALGYRNWDEYCTREFGTSRLRLPREERSEIVASLRESGLSDRAIESATGVSRRTLIRDRQVVTLSPPELDHTPQNPPPTIPQGEPVSRDVGGGSAALDALDAMADEALQSSSDAFDAAGGVDNYDQAVAAATDELAARRADFIDAAADVHDADGWAEELADAEGLIPGNVKVVLDQIQLDSALAVTDLPEPRITGTDGKSYPAKSAKKPNRRPLPDVARDAGWDLRKAVEKLDRLLNDDRFTRNRDEVATQIRSHLAYAIDSCQGFLDRLPNS